MAIGRIQCRLRPSRLPRPIHQPMQLRRRAPLSASAQVSRQPRVRSQRRARIKLRCSSTTPSQQCATERQQMARVCPRSSHSTASTITSRWACTRQLMSKPKEASPKWTRSAQYGRRMLGSRDRTRASKGAECGRLTNIRRR